MFTDRRKKRVILICLNTATSVKLYLGVLHTRANGVSEIKNNKLFLSVILECSEKGPESYVVIS